MFAVVRFLSDRDNRLHVIPVDDIEDFAPKNDNDYDNRAVYSAYWRDSVDDTNSGLYNAQVLLLAAQAIAMHQQKLEAEDDAAEKLASGAVNPSAGTVYYWYRLWRDHHYGSAVDPVSKLSEKAPCYLDKGADVRTTRSEDGTCWAVLVVTQVMKRTQGLSAAKEIIFVDSTASCDESQSSLTVVLTATAVGAMPLAVLLHSSQSSESYKAAFGLLKLSYPTCFGGTH
ncbi:hypothetical protein V5799_030893, partial [Amblyomma americanum]